MPRKVRIEVDLDKVFQRHHAGETIGAIAVGLGINRKTLDEAIKRAGRQGEVRSSNKPAPLSDAQTSDILKWYAERVPVLQIASRIGVERARINRFLLDHGLAVRGRSEAEADKWQRIKATPGGTERQTRGAHDAVRGRPHTDAHRANLAISNELACTRVGKGEREIADALRARGVALTQQKAVGRYNIDIGLHEGPIAVEVIGAFNHARHARHHRKKSEHLHNLGWGVIWVFVHHCAVDAEAVAKHVIALAERLRRDEAARRQDWVIRCDGQAETPPGLQGDGWPVVLSTNASHEHA